MSGAVVCREIDDSMLVNDPTSRTLQCLCEAFDHFNRELFGGLLRRPMLTISSHSGSDGYYKPDRFGDVRDPELKADEIAISLKLKDRPLRDALAVLVHNMVHAAQHQFGQESEWGRASRPGYHNRWFTAAMAVIGLPCDKSSGQDVHHAIEPGGPFDRFCTALIDSGYTIDWIELPEERSAPAGAGGQSNGGRRRRDPKVFKYHCPNCLIEVLGRRNLVLTCVACGEFMAGKDEH